MPNFVCRHLENEARQHTRTNLISTKITSIHRDQKASWPSFFSSHRPKTTKTLYYKSVCVYVCMRVCDKGVALLRSTIAWIIKQFCVEHTSSQLCPTTLTHPHTHPSTQIEIWVTFDMFTYFLEPTHPSSSPHPPYRCPFIPRVPWLACSRARPRARQTRTHHQYLMRPLARARRRCFIWRWKRNLQIFTFCRHRFFFLFRRRPPHHSVPPTRSSFAWILAWSDASL